MTFVAGGDKYEHAERVLERGSRGGHVASETALHNIYDRSMAMLVVAFEQNCLGYIDTVAVYDNPRTDADVRPIPTEIVTLQRGTPLRITGHAPPWFEDATRGTPFTLERLLDLYLDRNDLGR